MRNEYRLLQDGMTVAGSTSLAEIQHYALVYGQDGPVTIQRRKERGRWVALAAQQPSGAMTGE
jgi:hypothetical protein